MGFAYGERSIMRKSSGEPKSIEAKIESSNSEEREETEGQETVQNDEPSQDLAPTPENTESDDWWSASPQAADWGTPVAGDSPGDSVPSNEPRPAHIYFCGH